MEQTIIEGIEQYGYIAILFFLFLETIFPPIPSEVILLSTGVAVAHTQMTAPMVIGVSTFGSFLGATLWYIVGRKVPLGKIKSWSTYGFLSKAGVEYDSIVKGREVFFTKGKWIVFFGRFIPMLRSVISIPAGMAKMNFFTFSLFTLLGSGVWNGLSIYIGYRAGDSWRELLKFFHYYTEVIVVFGIIVLGGLLVLWKKRRN